MKNFTFLFLTLLTVIAAQAQTVITVKDADLGSGTYNWTSNNIYLLDGFIFLESGGTLNIQAGTVIKGKETPTTGDNASALIITRGATINANGSKADPIIFTSELDDLSITTDLDESDRGLWGGLIVLGNGVLGNSSPTAQIEGIDPLEPRGSFGGTNNADNSGIIRYISIRHGGSEIGAGNEINGLTLGGVGSGTTIEYVEIFANLDDGIEWFGGAVNVKYAVVAFAGDDAFDWDLGWVGNGQFWFAIQSADEGDHGGELDGAIPDANTIFSNPTVYNATLLGAGTSSTTANTNAALIFRDATAGTLANSIITDFATKAIEVEDLPAASGIDSRQRLENGDLKLLNNIWYNFGDGSQLNTSATGIIRATTNAEDPNAQFLITHLTNNNNVISDPGIYSISRTDNGQLDPRASATGPAYQNLASYPAGSFFTPVSYKGAFASADALWIADWTTLDQNGYLKNTVGVNEIAQDELQVLVAPNPASDITTIEFSLDKASEIKVALLDISGRIVAKVVEGDLAPGTHKYTLNISELHAGIYFYAITSGSGKSVQKLIIQ